MQIIASIVQHPYYKELKLYIIIDKKDTSAFAFALLLTHRSPVSERLFGTLLAF